MNTATDPHCITSLQELDELYDPPSQMTLDVILNFLDPHFQRLINQARFVCLATESQDGVDVTPRGGEPGFVHIIDERTIAIPDYQGNNKIETIKNIVRTGRAGTLFLFPGINYFIRVNGSAYVTQNPDLLSKMVIRGKTPKVAIVLTVDQAFFHCAKALIRSDIWKPEHWHKKEDLPRSAEMLHDQIKLPNMSVEDIAAFEEKAYRETLY